MRDSAQLLAIDLVSAAWSTCAGAHPTDFVTEPSSKQMAKLQALTPESVAVLVSSDDDSLQPTATLSTFQAYRGNGAFTDRVKSDVFLRAFIAKATGAVTYQVYQHLSYGSDGRHFTSANYFSAAGVGTAAVIELSSRLECVYGVCVRVEDLTFELPEATVREVAAGYCPGAWKPSRYKLRAMNGMDWEDRIMPAEAAGLLLAVQKYPRASTRWPDELALQVFGMSVVSAPVGSS